jgi:two-component system, NarL family, nitrate/nitrite response regulator NarL
LEILAIASFENLPTRLVFFTASIESHELAMSAAGGAYSIILKDAAPEILVQSLRQVADGQRLLPMLSSDQAPRLQAKIAISENALTVWEGSDPIQAARQAAKALLRRDPAAI